MGLCESLSASPCFVLALSLICHPESSFSLFAQCTSQGYPTRAASLRDTLRHVTQALEDAGGDVSREPFLSMAVSLIDTLNKGYTLDSTYSSCPLAATSKV